MSYGNPYTQYNAPKKFKKWNYEHGYNYGCDYGYNYGGCYVPRPCYTPTYCYEPCGYYKPRKVRRHRRRYYGC